jgi:hypothetical protein
MPPVTGPVRVVVIDYITYSAPGLIELLRSVDDIEVQGGAACSCLRL